MTRQSVIAADPRDLGPYRKYRSPRLSATLGDVSILGRGFGIAIPKILNHINRLCKSPSLTIKNTRQKNVGEKNKERIGSLFFSPTFFCLALFIFLSCI